MTQGTRGKEYLIFTFFQGAEINIQKPCKISYYAVYHLRLHNNYSKYCVGLHNNCSKYCAGFKHDIKYLVVWYYQILMYNNIVFEFIFIYARRTLYLHKASEQIFVVFDYWYNNMQTAKFK